MQISYNSVKQERINDLTIPREIIDGMINYFPNMRSFIDDRLNYCLSVLSEACNNLRFHLGIHNNNSRMSYSLNNGYNNYPNNSYNNFPDNYYLQYNKNKKNNNRYFDYYTGLQRRKTFDRNNDYLDNDNLYYKNKITNNKKFYNGCNCRCHQGCQSYMNAPIGNSYSNNNNSYLNNNNNYSNNNNNNNYPNNNNSYSNNNNYIPELNYNNRLNKKVSNISKTLQTYQVGERLTYSYNRNPQ